MFTILNRDGEVGPGYFFGFAAASIALALVSWFGDVSLATKLWILVAEIVIVVLIFVFASFNRGVRRQRAEHDQHLDSLLDRPTDPNSEQR